MENWGIVTYRESILLADEATSSFAHKLGTAHTVCHELAHQWFGNLVTMEWWTELWLNEGFARFMEHEAMHDIFPQWNVWANFVQDPLALTKDAMASSHPIEVVVHHPDEIDQVFDVIAYRKGAAVIRMLANFVGNDKFYVGIHNYLVKFAYGNAKTIDLWHALEAASGLELTSMAHTWTTQTGFPVVNVTKAANGSYQLTQSRFFADGTRDSGPNKTVWDVPLTYVTSTSGGAQSADSWVKVNALQQGFYLVNYSPELWKALQGPVSTQELDVVDRVALLQSVFFLSRAGHVSIVDALEFAQAYALDTEYLVWKELSDNLVQIVALFDDQVWFPSFQAYIRRLYAPIMARLTWTHLATDSDLTKQLRRQVIGMLGRANDDAVIAEASRRFQQSMHENTVLPSDFRADVFRLHITTTSEPELAFAHLTQLYHASSTEPDVKLEIVYAMGLFPQPLVKQRVLEWGLQNVRPQDMSMPFAGVAATAAGASVAWAYVQANWDLLNAQYPNPRLVGRILNASIRALKTDTDATDVETFLLPRQHAAYSRSVEETLESIRIKHVVATRDAPRLRQWLE
ncbi:hypothetical protein DYB38_011511 [Aphanomyces astaci]|uniref:Aminopeptidase n=1 Tax=Aphanomyces astaci TaxID=112090 RepID=A0A397C0W8_APHAT|nr:hypothetical protein DYB38_011511 [Aphanomyces astaci]